MSAAVLCGPFLIHTHTPTRANRKEIKVWQKLFSKHKHGLTLNSVGDSLFSGQCQNVLLTQVRDYDFVWLRAGGPFVEPEYYETDDEEAA